LFIGDPPILSPDFDYDRVAAVSAIRLRFPVRARPGLVAPMAIFWSADSELAAIVVGFST
jgi:hypothetical protein